MSGRNNYFGWVAISCLLVLTVSAGFNWVIDPYYIFQAVSLPGINTSKPATGGRTGLSKTYMVERARPDTLIAGTSMFDIGVDPESRYLPESARPAFNLSVPGSTVYEQFRLIQHAAAVQVPELIIMSVEFESFISTSEDSGVYPPVAGLEDFEKRLNVGYKGDPNKARAWQYLKDLSASLLSNSATMDSIRTVLEGDQQWITPAGFSSGVARFGTETANKGYFSVFRDKLQSLAQDIRSGHVYPRLRSFRALDDIIGYCRKRGIELVIVIPPSHAFHNELLEKSGLWTEFEEWKYMLAQMADRLGATGMPVSVWDFASYNDLTTERVPPPSDTALKMQWYWDPLHFKAVFGDLLIRQIFSGAEETIGTRLAMATVCAHLENVRRRKHLYKKDNRDQTDLFDLIVADRVETPAGRHGIAGESHVCPGT